MAEFDENTIFTVSDYLKDNEMILVGYDDVETGEYTGWKVPTGYKELADSRAFLYVDRFLGNFGVIHKEEAITTDIGNGMETLDIFTGEVQSEAISTQIGIGSTELYKELMYSTDDDNIKKLLGWYVNESEKATACSDGDFTIGLDKNGVLKLMSVQVGGIGDFLNITKTVITDTSVMEKVLVPVIENPTDYALEFKEMADMCAPYETYDAAIEALYHTENDTGEVILDDSTDLLDETGDITITPEEGENTIEVDLKDAGSTTIEIGEDENATLELELPVEGN